MPNEQSEQENIKRFTVTLKYWIKYLPQQTVLGQN